MWIGFSWELLARFDALRRTKKIETSCLHVSHGPFFCPNHCSKYRPKNIEKNNHLHLCLTFFHIPNILYAPNLAALFRAFNNALFRAYICEPDAFSKTYLHLSVKVSKWERNSHVDWTVLQPVLNWYFHITYQYTYISPRRLRKTGVNSIIFRKTSWKCWCMYVCTQYSFSKTF